MIRMILTGILALAGLLWVGLAASMQADGDVALGASPASLQQGGLHLFIADLTGAEEIPPVYSHASGRAFVVLDEDNNTLYWRLMVSDIVSITLAHIHDGAVGVNGPPVIDLYTGEGGFAAGNPISGTVSLTGTQMTKLLSGDYYANVHTAENPNGEIRGQLREVSPDQFNAVLHGEHETPPVETTASGWARFLVSDSLDEIDYEVFVSDTISITAAHLHPGWPGEAGPPRIPLYNAQTDPVLFDNSHPLSGTASLSPLDLLDLVSGYYYINIHTAAYPGGEIRGQVNSGPHILKAVLEGIHETPPLTDTLGAGQAYAVLDDDLHTLLWRVAVTDLVSITQAHFHIAPPGASGPPEIDLFTGAGAFDSAHPISGTVVLTDTQVSSLVAGNFYANVHTSAHPAGEIRGQLYFWTPPTRYTAVLSGTNEVPPVETGASGEAVFVIHPEMELDRM
ncbi:MAG: CHRD domain-containing protein, partial [Chloroflexota bacterium]